MSLVVFGQIQVAIKTEERTGPIKVKLQLANWPVEQVTQTEKLHFSAVDNSLRRFREILPGRINPALSRARSSCESNFRLLR